MEPAGFSQPNFVNIKVNEELLEYSKKSSKLYADKCEADYILIDKPKINHVHPTFERFDLFFNNEWWNRYENILYLDTDVICWPDAPNIFKMYNNNKTFKVCYDTVARSKSTHWHLNNSKNTILSKFAPDIIKTSKFNAGVLLLNKNSVEIIKSHIKYKEVDADDNTILIYAMLSSQVPTEYMDWRFNKKNGISCWFGHGYGQEKYKTDNKLLSMARQIFKI
jgi:hypothetical protein